MSKPTTKKPVAEKTSLVVPTVVFSDHVNPIISEIEDGLPMKAVGVVRRPGFNDWVAFTVELEGTTVTKIEVEEPNIRMVAEDTAKVAFVHAFTSVEL